MTPVDLVREGRILAYDGMVADLEMTTPCRSCPSPCILGPIGQRRVSVTTRAGSRFAVGARVQVAVSRSDLTRSSALMFGVPLFAWVCAGVVAGHFWGESAAVLLAPVALTIALLGLRAWRWSLRQGVKIELIAATR